MKIINISNRLPVSFTKSKGHWRLTPSSGGLVSAVESLASDEHDLHWVGVADFPLVQWLQNQEQYKGNFTLHPVFTEPEQYKAYYNGFSNAVLWPLCHYFPSYVEYDKSEFDAYLAVNRLIAEKTRFLIDKDDIVWIHDYHLMPLAGYLRDMVPGVKIGFFLHVPFPSYELIRILPKECREQLITQMLGADLIGFHTYDYVQHFLRTVQMIAGVQHKHFTLRYQNRDIQVGAFPISIDFKKFNQSLVNPKVLAERDKIRELYEGKKILFSVDRQDYTKGISYRLKGYARFLEQHPEWKEKVVFLLLVVPSRSSIDRYEERKDMIEQLISQINGQYGSYTWSPIVYQYHSVNFEQLSGLYTACDVALISPVRDGMNLVSKEFVSSRSDQKGVLVLSDMTGAAKELTEALLFNPMDESEISHHIKKALNMPEQEQQKRMESMQQQISKNDVFHWSENFVSQIRQVKSHTDLAKPLEHLARIDVFERYSKASKCLLLLDYDGTLSEIAPHPDLAKPKPELYALLKELSNKSKNETVIISGRSKNNLDEWFGKLGLTLIAEHGIFAKSGQWNKLLPYPAAWKEPVKEIMDRFSENCAHTFVEEKEYSLSWHYRNADPEVGGPQSRELINLLNDVLISSNANILDGKKVIEVKPAQANKGIAVQTLFDLQAYDCCICIGDDTTDEDMFRVVNAAGGISIKVGAGQTQAKYRVERVAQVWAFLSLLK